MGKIGPECERRLAQVPRALDGRLDEELVMRLREAVDHETGAVVLQGEDTVRHRRVVRVGIQADCDFNGHTERSGDSMTSVAKPLCRRVVDEPLNSSLGLLVRFLDEGGDGPQEAEERGRQKPGSHGGQGACLPSMRPNLSSLPDLG